MTLLAHLATEIWLLGPSKSQKYDLVGPASYRSVTVWAQSAKEVSLSGPSQLQKYELQGPSRSKRMTFTMTFRTQSASYVWPSGPNQPYMYDLQDRMSSNGIATTAWLSWFCLLNHVRLCFTFKGKYKKEKETKENLGLKLHGWNEES